MRLDTADIAVIASIVAVISAISNVILGWKGNARSNNKDTAEDVRKDAIMQSNVDYIKRGIDELRLEIKDQGRRFDELTERVTRVEESTKQAHHRLNRMESGKE